jgi:hypothetical protein
LSASRKGVQAAERVLLFLLKVIQSPSPPVALTEKARSLRQEGDGLFVYTQFSKKISLHAGALSVRTNLCRNPLCILLHEKRESF